METRARDCLLLLVVVCSCVLAVRSQAAILTVINITACSDTLQETVSLFKNDIISVDWNPDVCNDSVWEPNHLKGFQVSTISEEADDSAPVVFIAREADDGVVVWEIPLTPDGFDREFSHVNRTVCPIINPPGRSNYSNRTLFYLDVFTRSTVEVNYTVTVDVVPQFELTIDKNQSIVVGAASPQIYYFQMPAGVDAVTIEAVTENPRCAILSIQNVTCPVNILTTNARGRGLYQTMSQNGFVTVRSQQIRDRQFLLVLIVANYTLCHTSIPEIDLVPVNESNGTDVHYQQTINVTLRELKSVSTFAFAIIFPVLLFFALSLVAVMVMFLPTPTVYWTPFCKFSFDGSCRGKKGEEQRLLGSDNRTRSGGTDIQGKSYSMTTSATGAAGVEAASKPVNNIDDSSLTVSAAHEKDESKLKLTRMCKIKYKKLDRQYSIYGWNTITVGIFYALPAFQLVLAEQQIVNFSGNQDICYYNFKCAHPLGIFSAFNNVWSNVGYVMLGVIFIVIVVIKDWTYKRKRNDELQYMDSHGVPQLFGVYYAMGIALILEGFMSAFYHICPRDANFQFDTAFMFIIGGILIVKIFQNRHPDVHANAFVAFFSFAVVIFFTLLGIYFDKRNPLAVRFTIFFFVLVMVVLFLISFYNFHQWSLSSIVSACRDVRATICHLPKHKIRFTKVIVAFFLNLILAIAVIAAWEHIDIATAVLSFFLVNVLYFLVVYLFLKFYYKETWTLLPFILVFVICVLWGFAFYFFKVKTVTDWRLTPAESRELNHECLLLGYYDSHDIWHFLSASALLFSFLFLFVLDDGMANVKREDIYIF